jgi:hypothetical protein
MGGMRMVSVKSRNRFSKAGNLVQHQARAHVSEECEDGGWHSKQSERMLSSPDLAVKASNESERQCWSIELFIAGQLVAR